jgi:hypothetical protein
MATLGQARPQRWYVCQSGSLTYLLHGPAIFVIYTGINSRKERADDFCANSLPNIKQQLYTTKDQQRIFPNQERKRNNSHSTKDSSIGTNGSLFFAHGEKCDLVAIGELRLVGSPLLEY